jgi:dTDP-4-amino-4,6-dideoxygalactose transaminase
MPDVPFVDLTGQYREIRDDLLDVVHAVLESGWYILGQRVERFEREFTDYCGGGGAVGVGSGTDALHLALRACGLGPGDEVITVANTFVATVLAIEWVGARPVFVDVEADTGLIDARGVEAAITSRTKAILPVHLYGQPADMDPLIDLARRHRLRVVEDACQAHGAEYRGKKAGSIGDVGCFSFYPAKNLGAYGDGGMVFSRNPDLVERVRRLRNYGQTRKYHHELRGYNSRLDELQAAVLSVKLQHLDRWNDCRRAIAHRYTSCLSNPRVTLLASRPGRKHAFHIYAIRCTRRDDLARWLGERGVGTLIHYPVPIHLQAAYRDLNVGPGTLPATEAFCREVLSLPMYPELDDREAEWVIRCVNEFPPDAP